MRGFAERIAEKRERNFDLEFLKRGSLRFINEKVRHG